MNSILNKATKNGKTYFQIACCDQKLCDFFDQWSYSLAGRKKYKTVEAYAYGVKRFIDYFLEADAQLSGISDLALNELLQNFESYLAFGLDSDTALTKKIAEVIPPGSLSGSSITLSLTALNNFLEASEKFRVASLLLEEGGFIDRQNIQTSGIIERIGKDTPNDAVQRAVRQSSWFSACLRGGMKTIKKTHLKPVCKPTDIIYADEFGGDEKTFPYDLAESLIKKAPNLRDKLLWSLIAATGIRISEAMTMFESDVIIETSVKPDMPTGSQRRVISKKVLVIDPDTRRSKLILFLSETKINSLPHKGREHPDTYMIEPFASLFWRYLAEYKADQNKKAKKRPIGPSHPFLFSLETTGEPIVSSYQTLYESFKMVSKEVTGTAYAFHSLRHMYGYYVHNFAPKANGEFGLPLKQVQMLLGHASIKSTQRYARQDSTKLNAAMSALNMARSNDASFSINQSRIRYLENLIKEIKAQKDDGNKEIGND
jgi:integrase/recombinase XerD